MNGDFILYLDPTDLLGRHLQFANPLVICQSFFDSSFFSFNFKFPSYCILIECVCRVHLFHLGEYHALLRVYFLCDKSSQTTPSPPPIPRFSPSLFPFPFLLSVNAVPLSNTYINNFSLVRIEAMLRIFASFFCVNQTLF